MRAVTRGTRAPSPPSAVRRCRRARQRLLGDGRRLLAGAEEPRITSRSHAGSPMTSTLSSADASLTATGASAVRSLRSSFVRIAHGRSSPLPGIVTVEQLPRNGGGPAVELEDGRGAAPHERLEIDRHEQAEERAADLRVVVRAVRGCRHQVADQRHLRGSARGLRCARAWCRWCRRSARPGLRPSAIERADEIVLRAAISGVGGRRSGPIPFSMTGVT